MEIDTTKVFTDEQRDAIERCLKAGLSIEEKEKILKQLPKRLSQEQNEQLRHLESEGRNEEALTEGTRMALAMKVMEACISGRLEGILANQSNLPDQLAELERIAQDEIGPEIAYIEGLVDDTFRLPTRETVRLYSAVISDFHKRLKQDFKLEKKRKKRKVALGVSDYEEALGISDQGDELTRQEELLARICSLFRDATRKNQRDAWRRLQTLTRNQWALFIIESDPARKSFGTLSQAANSIIKPNQKILEEISGRTNMRSVKFVEKGRRYSEDLKVIREIINILKADAILRKANLLPLTKT